MTRDDVIRMALECGMDAMIGAVKDGKYEPKVNALKSSIPVEWLEQFAEIVRNAERRKHQADIEMWKAQAAQAERWRGMAHARHGDGQKVVQEIQREAAAYEREACAQLCDSLVDDKEAKRSAKRVDDAIANGDQEDQLQAMRHNLTVSTFNAGIKSCASSIRKRGKE